MTIHLACKCGKQYKVKDEYAGKHVKCAACGTKLLIPELTLVSPNLPGQPEQTKRPRSMPSAPMTQPKPKVREWILCAPAAFPVPLRLLIVFNVVFAEVAGRLLFFEPGMYTHRYGSPKGDLSIIVRRSFFSGRFTVEVNGVKGKLRKGARIPYEVWSTIPIVPSVGIPDQGLLGFLKVLGREDDFESTVLNRQGVLHSVEQEGGKEHLKSVREKVERAEQGSRTAVNVMGCGSILCVLGFGYFILPVFGYQFIVMKGASPELATGAIIVGFAAIIAGVVMFIANERRNQ